MSVTDGSHFEEQQERRRSISELAMDGKPIPKLSINSAKPPIGLTPRHIWEDKQSMPIDPHGREAFSRLADIANVFRSYAERGLAVQSEWVTELIDRLNACGWNFGIKAGVTSPAPPPRKEPRHMVRSEVESVDVLDYFAGQAMAAFIEREAIRTPPPPEVLDRIADAAYRMASAMCRVRANCNSSHYEVSGPPEGVKLPPGL